jgi:hypothetical protein
MLVRMFVRNISRDDMMIGYIFFYYKVLPKVIEHGESESEVSFFRILIFNIFYELFPRL